MAFNPNDPVQRIRLLVGDIGPQYLDDDVYEWLYEEYGNSDIQAAVAALEIIINYISLTPAEEVAGDIEVKQASVAALERRLASLKIKASGGGVPMMIHSDRKDWSDFDNLFDGK